MSWWSNYVRECLKIKLFYWILRSSLFSLPHWEISCILLRRHWNKRTNKQHYLNSSSPDANRTESPPPRTEIAHIQFYPGIHEKWHSSLPLRSGTLSPFIGLTRLSFKKILTWILWNVTIMFRFLPSSTKWSMVALLSQVHFVSTRGATISLCTAQTRYMTASSSCV